jgi:hypothetical protein
VNTVETCTITKRDERAWKVVEQDFIGRGRTKEMRDEVCEDGSARPASVYVDRLCGSGRPALRKDVPFLPLVLYLIFSLGRTKIPGGDVNDTGHRRSGPLAMCVSVTLR